jgi:hypothetical protein
MIKHKLSKLNEWAKDKPYFLVMMAQQLAGGTETCFKVLKLVKAGERIEVLSCVPDVREWLKLYRNHRRILLSAVKMLKGLGGMAREGALVVERTLFIPKNERRKILSEAEKKFDRVRDQQEAEINLAERGMTDQDFAKKMLEALKEPEIAFFFRVLIPCWFLYRANAQVLFKKARFGDREALENLLRLDPSVVSEPRIAEILHQARVRGKKGTFQSLAEALNRGPKGKVTLRKVMYRFAGLISLMSILVGHRLNEREVYNLFDAVAEDKGSEDLSECLCVSPQTFKKAIERERKFWMFLLPKGQKMFPFLSRS